MTEKALFDYRGLTGFDLAGRTLGIIGGGRIGMNVARIARNGFEMNVLVNDPHPNLEPPNRLDLSMSVLKSC